MNKPTGRHAAATTRKSPARHVKRALVGVAALAAAAAAIAVPASAAGSTPTPGNTAAIPQIRVVDTPGIELGNGGVATVPVAGKVGVPADATAVEGILTAYEDTGTSRLVVWDGVSGAPGTPTVIGSRTTLAQPSGASGSFHAALTGGTVKVHNSGASTRFLLTITGYDVPAAAPAAPAAFGVVNVKVDGTTWRTFDTVESGAPAGDNATGFVRFTCKNVAGCNVTVDAYSTAPGESVYPDLLFTKEDNTTGAKLTCEYADGSDNNGAVTALTGTKTAPTPVSLGIGGTADCGGDQTGAQPASVDHINVPGSTGQGIHYDVDVDFTFAHTG